MVKVAKQPNHNGKYFQKLVKEDEKLFENTLNKIQEPVPRKENMNERIDNTLLRRWSFWYTHIEFD